jgi:hypothetical protein
MSPQENALELHALHWPKPPNRLTDTASCKKAALGSRRTKAPADRNWDKTPLNQTLEQPLSPSNTPLLPSKNQQSQQPLTKP